MTRSTQAAVPAVALHGVHHTARPTWKLAETVHFYRDLLGLPLVHAISAKGWGPDNHADFLHFFFDSGNGSTIAFFYYIGTERPDWLAVREHYRTAPRIRHGACVTKPSCCSGASAWKPWAFRCATRSATK